MQKGCSSFRINEFILNMVRANAPLMALAVDADIKIGQA